MSPKLEKWLIVPDTHCPYHHKKAWALMLRAMRDWKPDGIVHLGDLPDFYAISRYPKNPARRLDLVWELSETNKLLDDLDSLKAKRKYYTAGNHCHRYDLFLQENAILGPMVKSFPEAMRFRERGWRYVPYMEDVRVGKVYFTHDVGAAGSTHKQLALHRYHHSVMTGHDHRMSMLVQGTVDGVVKLSAGCGWMGDAEQIDYRHKHLARTEWPLGFGAARLHVSTGLFYLTPVPIINGTCVVEGRLYR